MIGAPGLSTLPSRLQHPGVARVRGAGLQHLGERGDDLGDAHYSITAGRGAGDAPIRPALLICGTTPQIIRLPQSR
jgi:hypothetical protein